MERHFNTFPYGFIADVYATNWGHFFSSFHLVAFSPFPLQVKKLISGKGDGGFKLLSMAIETARVEMFEVVMATISDKLTEEEVRRCTLVSRSCLLDDFLLPYVTPCLFLLAPLEDETSWCFRDVNDTTY